MKRPILAVLIPPFAVCQYGCAGCCAAPIGVFWIAGISAIIYSFFGGPLQLEQISWNTLYLGIGLWLLAIVWAATTLTRNKKDESCDKPPSPICRIVGNDDHDPMDEINKYH